MPRGSKLAMQLGFGPWATPNIFYWYNAAYTGIIDVSMINDYFQLLLLVPNFVITSLI